MTPHYCTHCGNRSIERVAEWGFECSECHCTWGADAELRTEGEACPWWEARRQASTTSGGLGVGSGGATGSEDTAALKLRTLESYAKRLENGLPVSGFWCDKCSEEHSFSSNLGRQHLDSATTAEDWQRIKGEG